MKEGFIEKGDNSYPFDLLAHTTYEHKGVGSSSDFMYEETTKFRRALTKKIYRKLFSCRNRWHMKLTLRGVFSWELLCSRMIFTVVGGILYLFFVASFLMRMQIFFSLPNTSLDACNRS